MYGVYVVCAIILPCHAVRPKGRVILFLRPQTTVEKLFYEQWQCFRYVDA